jgi:protein-tyrosine phosphatase
VDRNSKDYPIRVDCIPDEALGLPEGSGTLGMTLAPGVKDWNWDRDMKMDMRRLRERWRTDVLVSLIESHEYERYKLEGYAEEAEASGIAVEEFPIVDVDIPREEQVEKYADLVGRIVGFLREGRNTVVHCRGGIGRTGTVVSSVLVGLGHDADDAMRLASDARRDEVPETEPQREYVREFARRYGGKWSR